MATITLDGVDFAPEDWPDRGHLDSVVVDGTSYPRWQALWVAGENQLNTNITGLGATLVASSTTSETIGTGSKALTVQTGKGFSAGMPIIALQTSDETNWMIGLVDSYNTSTGAIAFTVATGDVAGSGTITDWTVSISGRRGTEGGIAGGTLTGNIAGDGFNFTGVGTFSATTGTITTLTVTTGTVTDLTVSDKSDLQGVVQTAVAGQSKRTADESVDASADTDLTVDGAQVQYIKLTGDHTVNVFGGEADSNGAYAANGWVLEVEQDATGSRNLTIQKGNRITYSKDLQDTTEAGESRPWTDTNTSLDDNAAVGPDGQTTLTKLIEDANTAAHDRRYPITGLSPNQTIAVSAEFRDAGDGRNVRLVAFDTASSGNQIFVIFNPATGAVVSGPTNVGNGSGATAVITELPNSCWLLDLYGQPNTSGTDTTIIVGLVSGTSTSYTGDGTSGVYIGNVQVTPGQPKPMIEVGSSRALDGWIGTEVDFSAQAASTKTSVAVEGPEIDGYLVAAARERS